MAGLRTVAIVALLVALFLVVGGHQHGKPHSGHGHGHGHDHGRHHFGSKLCTNHAYLSFFLPPCDTTLVDEATSSPLVDATTTTGTTDNTRKSGFGKINVGVSEELASKLSQLERSHWCRLANGTHVTHGQIFMEHNCKVCQCKDSRVILCDIYQCMPTYCVDNKMPVLKSDQCCTQCEGDVSTGSCVHNGLSYPHGAIMKVVEHKMTCWCQLGHVECRTYMGSMFQGFNPFASGMFVYVIILAVLIPLCVGFFLCCSCSFIIYYYVQRHQAEFQQTYDQYMNSTGWQPIIEEEQQILDTIAEEKEREAEKFQSEVAPAYDIPPPYAIYHDAHAPVNEPKKA